MMHDSKRHFVEGAERHSSSAGSCLWLLKIKTSFQTRPNEAVVPLRQTGDFCQLGRLCTWWKGPSFIISLIRCSRLHCDDYSTHACLKKSSQTRRLIRPIWPGSYGTHCFRPSSVLVLHRSLHVCTTDLQRTMAVLTDMFP